MRPPKSARRASARVAECCSSPRLLLFACMAPQALAQTIPNPSFETNPAPTNFPGYVNGNTAISGWTTTRPDRVGLNPGTNFSPFLDNGAIPNGARVAFIESENGETATLSTTISG